MKQDDLDLHLRISVALSFIVIFKNLIKDFPGGLVGRCCASITRGLGSFLGQETRSHMPQLKNLICHNKDRRFLVLQLRLSTVK